MFSFNEAWEIVEEIRYKDWYLSLRYVSDQLFTLQWVWYESTEEQRGRIWVIDPTQPKSDIVRTAIFGAITAEEHEVRERFRYRGKKIFNPHFDVERLVEISGKLENLEIPAPVAQLEEA